MARPRPVYLTWTPITEAMVGKLAFIPHLSFDNYCKREFTTGETYPMVREEERSMKSHSQYFAAVHDGFQNLSEENAKRFPTSEHLRKWALVQCGYCTETNYVLANSKEARKLAADLRRRDGYTVMSIRDNVLQVWDAESQSIAAMKKEVFQQSKTDVLDLIACMARTTRPQLMKHAGRSA